MVAIPWVTLVSTALSITDVSGAEVSSTLWDYSANGIKLDMLSDDVTVQITFRPIDPEKDYHKATLIYDDMAARYNHLRY